LVLAGTGWCWLALAGAGWYWLVLAGAWSVLGGTGLVDCGFG